MVIILALAEVLQLRAVSGLKAGKGGLYKIAHGKDAEVFIHTAAGGTIRRGAELLVYYIYFPPQLSDCDPEAEQLLAPVGITHRYKYGGHGKGKCGAGAGVYHLVVIYGAIYYAGYGQALGFNIYYRLCYLGSWHGVCFLFLSRKGR